MTDDQMTDDQARAIFSPAVRTGDVATVERLIDHFPGLYGTRDSLGYFLRVAAGANQLKVAELLLRRGADVNAPFTESDPSGPIHDAASDGAVEGVRWLLEHGAELTVVEDGEARCPGLELAAMGGHLECVRLLVEAGAPLETSGRAALAMAERGGHAAVADYLRSLGVAAAGPGEASSDEDLIDACTTAAEEGDLKTLARLLRHRPDLLATPRELNYNLRAAAREGRVAAMELLVEHGADVNAPFTAADPAGPIHIAAAHGHAEAVRWLLGRGAAVVVIEQGEPRCPGLELAALNGHLDCVRPLVEAGAPLETSGDLALFAAKTRGHAAVAEYLRSVGATEKKPETGEADEEPGDDDLPPGYTLEDDEGEGDARGGPLPDLRQHLERRLLGTILPDAFHEILPSTPPIKVLVLDQFEVRKAIVTEGMSAAPMNGPVPFAELIMYLPSDWPLDRAAEDDRFGWPVNWLRQMAHLPHEAGKGYEPVLRFDYEEPLGPGTRFSGLLLLAGFGENGSYTRSDGETVQLYTVLPLYPEEHELADREGLRRLLALFDERQVPTELTPDRPSVVDGA